MIEFFNEYSIKYLGDNNEHGEAKEDLHFQKWIDEQRLHQVITLQYIADCYPPNTHRKTIATKGFELNHSQICQSKN